MPRYLMQLTSSVRMLDENGVEVGYHSLSGEVAIDSRSAGAEEIVDSATEDFRLDSAVYAKSIFWKERLKGSKP